VVLEAPSEPSAAREYAISAVKGAIGAIPYVGTLINEVAFEARSRLKQQRLEAFFAEVAREVEHISEEKIDRAYLQSEEFSDLFEDVALKVAQTRDDRKRAYFRTVLLNGIKGKRAPDFSTMFLALLHEITHDELEVLRGYALDVAWLREKRAEARESGHHNPHEQALMRPIDWSQDTIGGFSRIAYREIIQSLIRKGLMFDDSAGRLSTSPCTVVEGTDLGARFYEWITSA
jgi:hypothetical protein